MNLKQLSKRYDVKRISEKDVPDVLQLCKDNPIYYQYCPPAVSTITIKNDLKALPPNKTYEDKYYLGFYQSKKLIAVLDLICRYPTDETAFIGFFMVKKELQGTGVGKTIVLECLQYLKTIGYKKVQLGYVKDNPQPKAFWLKNEFFPTGVEKVDENYTIVQMEKIL